ncbi:hypothetical protein QUB63_12600 [Microcoleus sp. ARI1-B5]
MPKASGTTFGILSLGNYPSGVAAFYGKSDNCLLRAIAVNYEINIKNC